MKMHRMLLTCLPCLLMGPLLAQPQIGGGTCASSTLTGTYSLSITGRDLSSSVVFSNSLQGIGTATFDGLSKVTFAFTNNTNKAAGVMQTWSGTYSMQSNCLGIINITTGDTATLTLGTYNTGAAYFISGQDGVYSLLGSGNTVPATCSATTLSGVYPFNGNGFALTSGAISGVNSISGLLTFDGTSAVSGTWILSTNSKPVTTTGTYSVTSGCAATATLTDTSGNTYSVLFTIVAANGNFILGASNSQLMFQGSGRVL